MIILNAGIPRSGTILVNAVLRRLHEQADRPFQSLNLYGEKLEDGLRQASGMRSRKAHIFHMHDWSKGCREAIAATDRTVVCIANRRDPRDVCVSLKQLHSNPLDHSITLTKHSVRHHLSMLADLEAEVIRYEDDILAPLVLVNRLAKAIGIEVTDAEAASIVEATSVATHKKVMDSVATGDGENIRAIKNRSRILREDKATHINDRHIQSGRTGRWQLELSAEEQERLNAALTNEVRALGYRS